MYLHAKLTTALAVVVLGIGGASAAPGTGDWSFHRAVSASGKPICTLATKVGSGESVQNLVIKKFGGASHLNVTLYKDTWNIPHGRTIVTTIDFMDNQPLTLESYGDGKIVDIAIPERGTYVFLSLVRDSRYLQVGFPSGSEPTWNVPLSGVSSGLKQFLSCATKLTDPPKINTQPF